MPFLTVTIICQVAIAFPAAGMLTVIGYALLGFACTRTRALPGGFTITLIANAIAFGIGLSPPGG